MRLWLRMVWLWRRLRGRHLTNVPMRHLPKDEVRAADLARLIGSGKSVNESIQMTANLLAQYRSEDSKERAAPKKRTRFTPDPGRE